MIARAIDATRQAPEISKTAGCLPNRYLGSIESVAEISIILPDDLIQRLQAVSHGNVSAYIAGLVRNELDRQRLLAFVEELEEELGPTDEAEVAEYTAAFARTAAITRAMEKEAEADAEAE